MTSKVSVIVALLGGCGLVSAAEDLVRVPAGAYEVSDQITTLKVRVSVGEFLIGATEVTQGGFRVADWSQSFDIQRRKQAG